MKTTYWAKAGWVKLASYVGILAGLPRSWDDFSVLELAGLVSVVFMGDPGPKEKPKGDFDVLSTIWGDDLSLLPRR